MKVVVNLKAEIEQDTHDIITYRNMTEEGRKKALQRMEDTVKSHFPEDSKLDIEITVEGGVE